MQPWPSHDHLPRLTDAVLAPSDSLRDRTVIPYLSLELSRFEIKHPAGGFAIERSDERSFKIVGLGVLAGRSALDNVWGELAEMRAEAFPKDADADRLFEATCATLREWTDRLRAEAGDGFPEKVTAFRPGMAVHGRAGQPCPACGTTVRRIVYAENETNYCPRCQTGGKVLADRALSRLLKGDWPKTVEELEARDDIR